MAGGGQEILEASRRGDTGEVERLIREGDDVNRKGENGSSSIHWAAQNGHTVTVELLLDRGADPYITNKEGRAARDLDQTG